MSLSSHCESGMVLVTMRTMMMMMTTLALGPHCHKEGMKSHLRKPFIKCFVINRKHH